MSGVVNVFDCPTRSRKFYNCRCEICAVCGYRKHTAIHGGTLQNPTVIWGHEFQAREESLCFAYARYCGVTAAPLSPTQESAE